MAFLNTCNYVSTDAGSRFFLIVEIQLHGSPTPGSCTLFIWKPDWVSYLWKGMITYDQTTFPY